jgi:NAD(P)-dependent dehydrogenase (short-subunit alcohol dehydrogenase family)
VNQLRRSLAIEGDAKRVNVSAIAPVFTLTAISAPFLEDEKKKSRVILSRVPMKRLGKLEDLFGPVVFLAFEASRLVNGHVLPVDENNSVAEWRPAGVRNTTTPLPVDLGRFEQYHSSA